MKSCFSWVEVFHRPMTESPPATLPQPAARSKRQPTMKQIATLIEDLGQLTELDATKRRLDAKSAEFKKLTLEAEGVRERLPTAILHHYDLRVSKGRRGAAKMRNGTCGGCHLSLPSGQLSDLRRDDMALQVCGNCSIFILPEDPKLQEAPPPAVEESVPKPQPRKRKIKAVT